MRHFIIHIGKNRFRQTYVAAVSPCLGQEHIEDFIEQIYVINLINSGNDDALEDDDDMAMDIDSISTDEYLYYMSDYQKVYPAMSLSMFGNIMDEIVSIHRVFSEPQPPSKQYWAFILEGDHVDSDIDYVACKEEDMPLEDIIEEAYADIMYQVRRYHPNLSGIPLHSSILLSQTISEEEYNNQIERIESYLPY